MTASDEAKKRITDYLTRRSASRSDDQDHIHGYDVSLANPNGIAIKASDIRALLAEIDAKDAEIARLREAMAPFDRMCAAMFVCNWNRDDVAISVVEKEGPIRLTFADFLAVRAALKGDTHE